MHNAKSKTVVILVSFIIGSLLAVGLTKGTRQTAPLSGESKGGISNIIQQAKLETQNSSELSTRKQMTLSDVEEAIQLALKEPTDPLRRTALRRLADRIELPLLPELLPRLEKHFSKLVRYEMTQRLMQRWAQNNLNAAMAYVQKLPISLRRQSALEAVVGGMG